MGGQISSIRKFLSTGAILENGRFMCGCVHIENNLVLTAAHCLDKSRSPSEYSIRFGSDCHDSGGDVSKVFGFEIHEKYNLNVNSYDYDIAVILLDERVVYDDEQTCTDYAKNNETFELNSKALILGWGSTEYRGIASNYLRKAEVLILDIKKCKENYGNQITDRMICAGYWHGGVDSCQG